MSELTIKLISKNPNQQSTILHELKFGIEGRLTNEMFPDFTRKTLLDAIAAKKNLSNLSTEIYYRTSSSGESSVQLPANALEGFDFGKAKLNNANFLGMVFSGSEFLNADIRGANFTKATFKSANFTNQQLDNVNFSQVTFSEPANFSGARGSNVTFSNAKGQEINFDKSNLESPDFTKAQFARSSATGFTWIDPVLSQSDFQKSTWVGGQILFTREGRDSNGLKHTINLNGAVIYLSTIAGLNGAVPQLRLDMNGLRSGGNIFHNVELNLGNQEEVTADFSGARPHRQFSPVQTDYFKNFKGWDVQDLPPYFRNIKLEEVAPDGVIPNILSGFLIGSAEEKMPVQHLIAYDPVLVWANGQVLTRTEISSVLGAGLTMPREASLYPPERDKSPVIEGRPSTLASMAKSLSMPAYIGDANLLQEQIGSLKKASRTEGQGFAQDIENSYLRLVTGVITSGLHTFSPRTEAVEKLKSLKAEFDKFSFITPTDAQRLLAAHKAETGVPQADASASFGRSATALVLPGNAPIKEAAQGKIGVCAETFGEMVKLMQKELQTSSEISQSIENISVFATDLNLRLRVMTEEAENVLPHLKDKRPKMAKTVRERLDDLEDTLDGTSKFSAAFEGVLDAELATMRNYQQVITDALPSLNTNIMILLSSDLPAFKAYLQANKIAEPDSVSAVQLALSSMTQKDREMRLDRVREDTVAKLKLIETSFENVERIRADAVLNLAEVTGTQPLKASLTRPYAANPAPAPENGPA